MIPFWKKIRETSRPGCAALVVAAGSSQRMGGVNKLFQPLDGGGGLLLQVADVSPVLLLLQLKLPALHHKGIQKQD